MSTEQVRDFFSGYEDATIGARIPDNVYHVVVTENLGVPEWAKLEQPVVELEVEVASGEYVGVRVPRLRLQLGGFSFPTKSGEVRYVTEESVYASLQGTVRAIHGPTPPEIDASLSGEALLDALADALIGDDFIATVRTNDKTGYQDLKQIRSKDDPPKGFVLAKDLEEFRV